MMANEKWADFCISEVRYDKAHKQITAARVHADNGQRITESIQMPRATILSNISRGYSYITITAGPDGKWDKGQPVAVVTIDRVPYFKSVENQNACDTFEGVPEY